MLNLKQERTLISAIAPKRTGHINGIYRICFNSNDLLVLASALFASLPYDFLLNAWERQTYWIIMQVSCQSYPVLKQMN